MHNKKSNLPPYGLYSNTGHRFAEQSRPSIDGPQKGLIYSGKLAHCLPILLNDTAGDVLEATEGNDCKLETRNKFFPYLLIWFLPNLVSVDASLDLV